MIDIIKVGQKLKVKHDVGWLYEREIVEIIHIDKNRDYIKVGTLVDREGIPSITISAHKSVFDDKIEDGYVRYSYKN